MEHRLSIPGAGSPEATASMAVGPTSAPGPAVSRGVTLEEVEAHITGRLLTLLDVAERGRVSLDTVKEWVRRGLLPFVNLPTGRGNPPAPARTRARVHAVERGRRMLRVREVDWVQFVNRHLARAR